MKVLVSHNQIAECSTPFSSSADRKRERERERDFTQIGRGKRVAQRTSWWSSDFFFLHVLCENTYMYWFIKIFLKLFLFLATESRKVNGVQQTWRAEIFFIIAWLRKRQGQTVLSSHFCELDQYFMSEKKDRHVLALHDQAQLSWPWCFRCLEVALKTAIGRQCLNERDSQVHSPVLASVLANRPHHLRLMLLSQVSRMNCLMIKSCIALASRSCYMSSEEILPDWKTLLCACLVQVTQFSALVLKQY